MTLEVAYKKAPDWSGEQEVYVNGSLLGHMCRHITLLSWEHKAVGEKRYSFSEKAKTKRQCRIELMNKLNIERG